MKKILLIVLCIVSTNILAQNTASKEVLLDNESVEMVRLSYPPGTESGFHAHIAPFRTVYVVQGGQLELIPQGKENGKVIEAKTGMAMYLPAATHNVRNAGDTEIVLIETELKESGKEN